MKSSEKEKSMDLNIEKTELKGFSRRLTEIEFLLLILVILYFVVPGSTVTAEPFSMMLSMLAYAFFVLGFNYFNYVNLNNLQYTWKIAIETWVMIFFITWVLWNTGDVESPLLNLYLLVVIASAITLDKVTTFLEIMLIFAFYIFLGVKSGIEYNLGSFSVAMVYFSPLVLVAYITSMLASDVRSTKMMFKILSETDEMTNLLNKRTFIPMFNEVAEVAMKYNQSLSVMMIDADNLKEVNDKYGHKAGDKLIVSMSRSIEDCLRTSDIICRYGGDEFVALLPQLSSDRAIETGERLRSAIENTSFDVDGTSVSSTVSIGIASFPDQVGNVFDLLGKADQALYVCKRSGRNKVTSYSSIMPASEVEHILSKRQYDPKQGGTRETDKT